MKNTKPSLIIILIAMLVGCASTESIVISNRAEKEKIEEGIVYSLPIQLVKVVYNRKVIDSAEAAEKKQKAKDAIDSTNKEINKISTAEKELVQLIRSIPQAPNKAALEATLNLDLTRTKAQKLRLTNILVQQKKAFSISNTEYVQSLQYGKAFSEQIEITPEAPIADTTNTFYARMNHQGTYSDSLEIVTKNGLLDGAVGQSEDKAGEIVVSLARGISGLVRPYLGIRLPEIAFLNIGPPPDGAVCIKQPVVSITRVIDPSNQQDIKILNKQLYRGCIELGVKKPETIQTNALKNLKNANGLIYRQPGSFTFIVSDILGKNEKAEIQSIRLKLIQGGQIGVISMPKGSFSKNEYDVSFSNGMLSKSKISQPSEVLGAVMILPNVLKEVFAFPTELIQLKVDYSSSKKELVELKKAMLEAQAEINIKQLELEGLRNTKTNE